MAVFKRKRKVRLANGKKVVRQSSKWYVKYRDADGVVRCIPGFTDKLASQQLEAKLVKEAELAKAGIVDRYREHRNKPLLEHLKDFRQSLLDKGDTRDHARLTHNRVKAMLSGCKLLSICDVQASRIQRYLAERRQSGLSIKSCNYYLTAAKSFFNWMVDDKRMSENPVAHLKGQNANTDIRRARRSLEPDEIRRLLEKTAKGPERFGMSGYERSLLYRFAAETGLRANEVRKLKVGDFNFDNLTVTIKAGYSKHRREDVQSLRQDTAALLKEFLKDKMSMVKAFGGRYKQLTKRTSDMIKADLAETEEKDKNGKTIIEAIPYIDDAGRYADFHSLRHTTGSLLAASGVHPKVAQSIMRHSDINLTMSRYSHVLRGQESEAIEGLPDLSLPSKQNQQAKATGTDGSGEWTPKWTPELTPAAFSECDRSSAVGNRRDKLQENASEHNYKQNRNLDSKSHRLAAVGMGEKEVGRGGFEPPTHGFSVRCSTN
jgi:integrase